jgi:hypothetical protein
VSAADRQALAERARLVGRAALLLSVAPMLFSVWQAIGVAGIPGLNFGDPFAHADSGLVVRVAGASHDPLRVDHPVRIEVRRARAAASLRERPRTIKPAVAAPTSPQHAVPTPARAKTPAARTAGAAAATGPSAGTGVADEAPIAAPSTAPAPVQAPTLPSVQIPAVQIPAVQVPAVQISLTLPVVPGALDFPVLPTVPVLAPALP